MQKIQKYHFFSGPVYIIIRIERLPQAAADRCAGGGNSATNSAQNEKAARKFSLREGFVPGIPGNSPSEPGNSGRSAEPGAQSEDTMVNKVRVTIAGAPYAIATTDSETYITSLAKKLDEDIGKLLDANENLSVTKAAVFCAMDYLDEYRKSTGSAENMRSQIQDYIADAARAKLAEDKTRTENETLRRENDALREQLARMQARQKAVQEAKKEEKEN